MCFLLDSPNGMTNFEYSLLVGLPPPGRYEAVNGREAANCLATALAAFNRPGRLTKTR
jgi:hypothetical protein